MSAAAGRAVAADEMADARAAIARVAANAAVAALAQIDPVGVQIGTVSTDSSLHPTAEMLADDAAMDAMVPLPHEITERDYECEVEEGEDLRRAIEES